MDNLPKWVLMWVREFKRQLAELKKVVFQRVGDSEADVFWDEIDVLTKRSFGGEKEPVQGKMVLMRYPAFRKELELLEAMCRRAQIFLNEKDVYGSNTEARQAYYHVTKMLDLVKQAQDVLTRHERLLERQLSQDLDSGEQRTLQTLESWLKAFDHRRERVMAALENVIAEYESTGWNSYLQKQSSRRMTSRVASAIAGLVVGLASSLAPTPVYAGPPETPKQEAEREAEKPKPAEGSKEFYEAFDNPKKLQEYLAPLEQRYNALEAQVGKLKERIPDDEEEEHETLQKRLAALQQLGQSLSRGYVRLGDLHIEESKNAQVLEDDSRKAVRFDPNNWEGYQNLAASHYRRKQFRECVETCSRAILIAPEVAMLYRSRGTALYYLKDYEKALTDFRKAKELDPNLKGVDSWINGVQKLLTSR